MLSNVFLLVVLVIRGDDGFDLLQCFNKHVNFAVQVLLILFHVFLLIVLLCLLVSVEVLKVLLLLKRVLGQNLIHRDLFLFNLIFNVLSHLKVLPRSLLWLSLIFLLLVFLLLRVNPIFVLNVLVISKLPAVPVLSRVNVSLVHESPSSLQGFR